MQIFNKAHLQCPCHTVKGVRKLTGVLDDMIKSGSDVSSGVLISRLINEALAVDDN